MKKILMAVCVLGMVTLGCKKGYLDINAPNPNSSTVGTPELILPNALNVTASRQITGYVFISGWMGQWAISGSYAPSNSDFTTYRVTTSFGDGLWNSIYDNLEDYQYIITASQQQSKPFYEGAAWIMRSYEYQQLVDMFGDIPYSSALQGTSAILPTYDDAQTIYTDLVDKLDTGIALIKRSTGASASSDIMFGGNTTQWVQFANSLKLRILMRQSELAGRDAYIKQQIAAIQAEGSGFLEDDAQVNPGYLNTIGKQNPFYAFNVTPTGTVNNDRLIANAFAIKFYDVNSYTAPDYDPRGREIYAPTATSVADSIASVAAHAADPTVPIKPLVFTGNNLGLQGPGRSKESFFGPGVVKSYDQAATVMTAAESYLLQAEAAARGWMTGADAAALYHSAIAASFAYYDVPDAETAAMEYYSAPANTKAYWNNSAALTAKLNLIIEQKWAAENTATPFEEWCDYRRLPNLPFNQSIPISLSTNIDVAAIPVRLLYPVSEYSSNAANVKAQNQSADAHHTSKIFWMP